MSDYTSDQAAALRKAIASGVHLVRVGDHITQYRSVEEMRVALSMIERDLAAAGPQPSYNPAFSRGV